MAENEPVDTSNEALGMMKYETDDQLAAKVPGLMRRVEHDEEGRCRPNVVRMLLKCAEVADRKAPGMLEQALNLLSKKMDSMAENIAAEDARDIRMIAREVMKYPEYAAGVDREVREGEEPPASAGVQQHVHVHIDTQKQLREMEARDRGESGPDQ